MEPSRLFQIFRRRWAIIVSFAAIGIGGGALATAIIPPQYSTSTRLFVAVQTPTGTPAAELVAGNAYAIQKVFSYVEVVASPRVLSPVIEELGLSETPDELAEDITASVAPNSVVIQIDGTSTSGPAVVELVEEVARSFEETVVELESPIGGGTSPVKVEVLQPPQQPDEPSAPLLPLNLALGLFVGLAAGALTALILGLLDRRIYGRSEVEKTLRVPVLGEIAALRRSKKRPLVTADDPRDQRAEAFRTLRTNLQFVGADRAVKSVLVTSALSGEGRTTTVLNLAAVLSQSGAKVAVVEADLRSPRMSAILGFSGGAGLSEVLIGRVPLVEALRQWPAGSNATILPAGAVPPDPTALIGSKRMSELVSVLSGQYDYVLIDSPPALPVTDAALISRLADATIFVVRTGVVDSEQVTSAVAAVEAAGGVPAGVVLTHVSAKGIESLAPGARSRRKNAETLPGSPGPSASHPVRDSDRRETHANRT